MAVTGKPEKITHLQGSCARKVFTIFVEGDGHHTVRAVKGFFDTITVVDININVQNTSVAPVAK